MRCRGAVDGGANAGRVKTWGFATGPGRRGHQGQRRRSQGRANSDPLAQMRARGTMLGSLATTPSVSNDCVTDPIEPRPQVGARGDQEHVGGQSDRYRRVAVGAGPQRGVGNRVDVPLDLGLRGLNRYLIRCSAAWRSSRARCSAGEVGAPSRRMRRRRPGRTGGRQPEAPLRYPTGCRLAWVDRHVCVEVLTGTSMLPA